MPSSAETESPPSASSEPAANATRARVRWLVLVVLALLLAISAGLGASRALGLRPGELARFVRAELLEREQVRLASDTLALRWYERVTLARVSMRYGAQIEQLVDARDLPASYFEALIFLETGGRPSPRQEPAVFEKLRQVRDGERQRLGAVTQGAIHDASDEALMNLATSWGPFQILGWHCLEIGILVADIRGEDTLAWGVTWIDKEYGHLLRTERFQDAFHYHNAGSLYPSSGPPRTYHPDYVERGLRSMRAFEELGGLYR